MKYSAIIESLQILAKRDEKNGLEAQLDGADHDCIYGPSADFDAYVDGVDPESYVEEHGEYPNYADAKLSAEDNARLYELGWFVDPESEHWKAYV